MSRVPDVPPKHVTPVRTLSEFKLAGYRLVSHCSSGVGHHHALDYDALIAELGDVEVDYRFKRSRACPECGAVGGGLSILSPNPQDGRQS
jgi:hypothetical protein